MKNKKKKNAPKVTERITFRVSRDTVEKIQSIADAKGLVKVSDVIRMAIKQMLKMEGVSGE